MDGVAVGGLLIIALIAVGSGVMFTIGIIGYVDMEKEKSAKYVQKSCTVVTTQMDEWPEWDKEYCGADYTQDDFQKALCVDGYRDVSYPVYLPKVIVNVDGEEVKNVEAHKFLEQYSNSKVVKYVPGPQAWLANFTVPDRAPADSVCTRIVG
eukprot:gnl/TRDRNA2_/TRDRNA2_88235_c1_seq2.p1 gnl/TRDRNA2_/TRDRNA2_88235_c1~~gnl/TRDRNA2_/TRDRNA2_88235_c1_seq2.p1  ORF type:complete len:152 (+),score=21.52 gnl/TRDRNA2_/TRDRNA2_88235_c1_seq2:70-525(+)